ncbi:unnamed protein product [Chrysoparadoxa australica]
MPSSSEKSLIPRIAVSVAAAALAIGAARFLSHGTLSPSNAGTLEVCPGPLMVATRVHNQQSTADAQVDLGKVRGFIELALSYADVVAIAVGDGLEESVGELAREIEAKHGFEVGKVQVMHVHPWGNFAPALNALVALASQNECPLLLLQSLETEATAEAVASLRSMLTANDLVAGAALPGHEFRPGQHTLTGVTTPWNTLSLWSVPKLAKVGFLTVAEGLVKGVAPGIEEVSCISLLQLICRGNTMGAKLVKLNGLHWDAAFQDEGRRAWHANKMSSKVARAEAQMAALGIQPGKVLHIDSTDR